MYFRIFLGGIKIIYASLLPSYTGTKGWRRIDNSICICMISIVTDIYGYDTDVAGYLSIKAFAMASANTACGQSFVCLNCYFTSKSTAKVMSGRCLHFYVTLTQNEDVMTSNKCLKYYHPTKPEKAYTYEWFAINHFSWAVSDLSV